MRHGVTRADLRGRRGLLQLRLKTVHILHDSFAVLALHGLPVRLHRGLDRTGPVRVLERVEGLFEGRHRGGGVRDHECAGVSP